MGYQPRLSGDQEEQAQRLHREAVVIDGCGGGFMRRPPQEHEGQDYVDQMRGAGVTATVQTCAMPGDGFLRCISAFDEYGWLLEVARDRALQAFTVADIQRAKAEGKHALIFGLQGADPVETNLEYLRVLFTLGLRIMNLVYNRRNALGDGCSEPENRGLTAFGRTVVFEANRLGVLLDGSHSGERTTLDAASITEMPFVFSHSNPKRLCPSPRNITDDQIKAAAATGGLVGIVPHSMFLYRTRGERPTLEVMLEHVEYVAGLVGVDHVALGTDLPWGGYSLNELAFRAKFEATNPNAWAGYTAETKYCEGFATIAEYPNFTRGLVSRGFSDEDVRKIVGGNWLRVFEAVWPAEARGIAAHTAEAVPCPPFS